MMKLVVLSCILAAVAASEVYLSPWSSWPYGASLIQPSNYRGPLSLAPGEPADVLGSDGRPLDTLDVNLDRAAHFTAKALDSGYHLLKKRSAPVLATPYAAAAFTAAYPLAYSAAFYEPSNYRGPLSLAPGQPANILGADGRPLDTLEVNQDRLSHLAARSGIHILKKRSVALTAPISSVAIARSAYYPSAYSYSTPIVAAPLRPLSYAAAYSPWAYASPIAPLSYSATPVISILKK